MIAFSDKAAANGAEDSSQSKKARVLCLARSDPFLTVEEIARSVGTTSRYVRTSLSEAGLTLTELRRRFVEDLRQRLREEFGADGPVPDLTPRGPAGSPADGPGSKPAAETRRLRVAQRVDADLAGLVGVAPGAPLRELSRGALTAEALRVEAGHPILRSSAPIATSKGVAAAVEISYFDALRVRVKLETAARLPVRVIEREAEG